MLEASVVQKLGPAPPGEQTKPKFVQQPLLSMQEAPLCPQLGWQLPEPPATTHLKFTQQSGSPLQVAPVMLLQVWVPRSWHEPETHRPQHGLSPAAPHAVVADEQLVGTVAATSQVPAPPGPR
jgi:hypothetical protein